MPGLGFGPVTPIAYGLLGLTQTPAVPLSSGPGYVTPIAYGIVGMAPWMGPLRGG